MLRLDIFLACGLGVLAIVMYLLPNKTPLIIIILLVIAFCLSFYIVWTFPWVKDSLGRRFAGLLFVAACLCILGDYVWPSTSEVNQPAQQESSVKKSTAEEIAERPAKKQDNVLSKTERLQKENARRKKIRDALAWFIESGYVILIHCEGINPDGTPLSTQIDPYAEFAKWNEKLSDYLMHEKGLGYIYHTRKENVGGMLINIPPRVPEKNKHTYTQVKARMSKLEEFGLENKEIY